MKRFAVHRVYLDSATYVGRGVVTVNERGEALSVESLGDEVPSTQWIGGVIFLSAQIGLSAQEVSAQWLTQSAHPLLMEPGTKLYLSLDANAKVVWNEETAMSAAQSILAIHCESFDFQHNALYPGARLFPLR